MTNDGQLREWCRALLEQPTGAQGDLLDAIATELMNRKLLDPNESIDTQNDLIRRFARAFANP